ncbi:hypothetical protein T484DRAFT_1612544, partial [Baffinella frigidus]
PRPQTPNPKPSTPNTKHQTPNPKPQSPISEPRTPNPDPRTPKPEALTEAPTPQPGMHQPEVPGSSVRCGRGVHVSADDGSDSPAAESVLRGAVPPTV